MTSRASVREEDRRRGAALVFFVALVAAGAWAVARIADGQWGWTVVALALGGSVGLVGVLGWLVDRKAHP